MRADALRRRATLVSQARRLFAARGGDIGLEAVAAASGVGIATLYRNFPSRESLLVAVVLDILADIRAAVGRAGERGAQDPWEAWSGLVRDLVAMDVGALTDALGRASREGYLAQAVEPQQQALEEVEQLLCRLQDAGTVREDLSALEVVVAVATITRPQPQAIREAAPDAVGHLVEAFLAWSRAAGGAGRCR